MRTQFNIPVSGNDLASLLDGEEGLYLCQHRGQNYLTVAKAGHSIAFGPTPVGRAVIEAPQFGVSPEPWTATKISDSTDFEQFSNRQGQGQRQQR